MDEEFSGGGDQGDFEGFAFGEKVLVERFQDGIGLGGDEGGHPQPVRTAVSFCVLAFQLRSFGMRAAMLFPQRWMRILRPV